MVNGSSQLTSVDFLKEAYSHKKTDKVSEISPPRIITAMMIVMMRERVMEATSIITAPTATTTTTTITTTRMITGMMIV